jgi:dihydroflavonol-4-reductase
MSGGGFSETTRSQWSPEMLNEEPPDMTNSTILVTGISGFIAKHCAVELLKHGYRVRGTVRNLAKAEGVKRTLAEHADVARLEFVPADLLADEGWAEAVKDVYGVLHLASPFPLAQPKDAEELIRPAVDGTLRVLRAATAAGAKRFVQTSSTMAVAYGHGHTRTTTYTENDWTNTDGPGVTAYIKSKTMAERAARDFVAKHGAALHYASVNPGFVLGPLLDSNVGSSAELIANCLRGKYPGCPNLSFPSVDVRDVAKAHRLALETSEPTGGRYLAVAGTVWFKDLMLPIKARLGDRAKKIPTRALPNWAVWLVALFDPAARTILPELGYELHIDNSATRKALGMDFIDHTESAPAMAESLLSFGLVSDR